jgi:hypothetical protein
VAAALALIPNLGIDLIVPPMLRFTTPFVAGEIALAFALLLPVIGAIAYNWAIFRERRYWPMVGGLMAYNIIFVLGFINYLMAIGAALFLAAAWIRLRSRSCVVRASIGALFTVVLFFIHIFGVVFFAVLIGVAEIDALFLRPIQERTRHGLVCSVGLLASIFAIPICLWTLVPAHSSGALYGTLASKLFFLAGPFIGYQVLPGVLIALALYGSAIGWIATGKCRVGPGIPVAALVLAGAWLLSPFAIVGGTFFDSRIPMMLALILAAGMGPPAMAGWLRRSTAAMTVLALVIEIAGTSVIWHRREAQVAELRRTIAPVSPGSKVLVVSAPFDDDNPYWHAAPGLLAMGLFRTDYNLGALVAIDRRAFWPGLYANPSQQPIEVQPPFNDLAAPGWPPEMLSLALGRSTDPAWPAPYLESWQANFDFVLVLDAGATQGIANYLPDRLTLIASSRFAALFRIRS